jgi:hypothetical protein
MSNSLWTARLNPESPRFETWWLILGSDVVPLLSPRTYRANFGEAEVNVTIYKLDVANFTVDQRDRLVQWISEKFGAAPAEINRELEAVGFPIREVDVVVAYSLRAFI